MSRAKVKEFWGGKCPWGSGCDKCSGAIVEGCIKDLERRQALIQAGQDEAKIRLITDTAIKKLHQALTSNVGKTEVKVKAEVSKAVEAQAVKSADVYTVDRLNDLENRVRLMQSDIRSLQEKVDHLIKHA